MGYQLNSKAHRLGISEGWDSAWPPGSSEKDIIHAENEIREFVKKFLEATLIPVDFILLFFLFAQNKLLFFLIQ